ncbi:translation initiation factor eIF2 assembly protein-like [Dysidea avara]|uniref:translation initiation factor eIF2 assembly protein-like n=1 Tax=Dysidea avara TaxID=196820 RepID=UPI00332A7C46
MAAGVSITAEEVCKCAITSWYKDFRDVTITSKFIPLTDAFTKYLLGDGGDVGLVLPKECSLANVIGDSDSTDSSVSWDDDDDDGIEPPSFPNTVEAIMMAITELGGAVFPKLNWSSPRDATWVAIGNTLRCTCPSDVILLLKSSDFVMHDLSRVGEYCGLDQTLVPPGGFSLCLRRWVPINPSGEFRCFVKDSQLIGVSQRDTSGCYPHLLSIKDQLMTEVVHFFSSNLLKKFLVKSFVFDVYRRGQADYQLIDINPFGDMTDPLLFSWSELCKLSLDQELPIVRLVEHAFHTIQPSDLIGCRLPKECSQLVNGDDDYVEKFVELCKSARDDIIAQHEKIDNTTPNNTTADTQ